MDIAAGVEKFLPSVRAIAWQTVRRRPWLEREDVQQELLLALPSILGEWDPACAHDPDAFVEFVVGRLRWRAADYARRESPFYRPRGGVLRERRRGGPSLDRGDEAEDALQVAAPELADVAERLAVRRALTLLPRRYRVILFRRYFLEHTHDEIANDVGVTAARIVQLNRRALELLHTAIESGALLSSEGHQADRRMLPPPGPATAVLSPAELNVLAAAAAGLSSDEIGAALGKATETVKVQRRAIIAKLEARNIANAVYIACRRGIL